MKFAPLFFLLLALLPINSIAQTWDYAATYASPGYDAVVGIEVDNEGNQYVFGQFQDTLIIGTDTLFNTSLPPISPFYSFDMFLAKYDTAHQLVWLHHIYQLPGSPINDNEYAYDLTLSPDGSLYICGTFSSYYGLHIAGDTLAGPGLIARFQLDGSLVWAREWGSSSATLNHITADHLGNVFLGGYYTSGLSDYEGIALTTMDWRDALVAAYDSSGTFHWVRGFPGSDYETVQAIAPDNEGGAVAAITYDEDLLVDGQTLVSDGDLVSAIIRFDTVGATTWLQLIAAKGQNPGVGIRALATDLHGNIWAGGNGSDTLLLDGIEVASNVSPWTAKPVLAKLAPDGAPLHLGYKGAYSSGYINDLDCDPSGNVYGAVFNRGVYKFNQLGNLVWTKYVQDEFIALALTEDQDVYTCSIHTVFVPTTVLDTITLPYPLFSDDDFYIARITQPNPCPDTLTASISANGPLNFCLHDSVLLSTDTGFAAYQWNQGGTGASVQAKTSGYWYAMVTDTAGCTAATPLMYVNASPDVSLEVSSGTANFCAGDSVTLSAAVGAYSYAWNTGDTTASITLYNSDTLWVQITDTAGCSGTSDTLKVGSQALPTTVVTADTTQFCLGDSATLSAATGFTSYAWSNGATGSSATLYQSDSLWVQLTDTNGCTNTIAGVAVQALDTGIAIQVLSATSICQGETALLAIDTNLATYSWTGSYTGDTIAISITDTIGLAGTRTNGCPGNAVSVSTVLNPLPQPQLFVTGNLAICDGQQTNFATLLAYAGYAWSTGQSQANIAVAQSDTVWVEVTDANGCTNLSDTAVVQVWPNPQPTITITGDTMLCPGQSVSLSTQAFTQYTWTGGAAQQSININGAGSWQVQVTDSNGCTATSNTVQTLFFDTAVSILSSSALTFCEGGSVQLSASQNYPTYSWSTGATGAAISVDSNATIGLQITNANGCTGTAQPVTVVVYANPTPQLAALGDTSFCEGDSVVLELDMSYPQIAWPTSANTQQLTVLQTGLYSATVTDANNCTASSNAISVVANPYPTAPVISYNTSSNLLTSSELGNLQWYFNGTAIQGAATSLLTPDSIGPYTVTLTSSEGCTVESAVYDFTGVGISQQMPQGWNVSLFPNPAAQHAQLQMQLPGRELATVTISDASGRMVWQQAVQSNHQAVELPVQALDAGLYLVRLSAGSQQAVLPLVISH